MAGASGTARIGVDIGGTFTDLVLTDAAGRTFQRKVSSTPAAPEEAVLTGVREILDQAGIPASEVGEVVHGTTVGSNTLLQKVGAPTGLITTRGFRDVLEIGRLRTPGMFDLQWEKPRPLVPRRHRREVAERITASGAIHTPLDEAELIEAGRALAAEGIKSVAICFLSSYRNPEHERRAEALLAEHVPELQVTTSVSVLPEAKEYERTSTTVVNAYVRPVLEAYLTRLERGLSSIGVSAPLLVCNSNGALASSGMARAKPVFFISSGRAAGVVGGGRLGEALGEGDLVVFDMGGTTASASLIQGGHLMRVSEYEFRAGISTPSRFIKAGGYMMSVPTVDVAEVGSGAGSIAHVDEGGLMKVGPVSAGADPGPACYGIGGDKPTVTDANLYLGYLPDTLAGGSRKLSREMAEAAIARDLAEPFGLDAATAAYGVREVVNANMARAIRAVTVERGVDPRDFTLVAIGGSGPVHAVDIARLLSMPRVLVPASPGVFTAMGMLAGDVEHYLIRPLPGRLDGIDLEGARRIVDELAAEARERLLREGVADEDISLQPELDMRFRGQEMSLAVPFGEAADAASLRVAFLAAYGAIYSYASDDIIETVSLRLIGRGLRPGKLDFRHKQESVEAAPGPSERREVYFGPERGWIDTPIYDRATLRGRVEGPAILQGADSTVLVPPDASAVTDPHGNLLITLAEGSLS
ncbi:hydantoinase/oxoprolinase family protein [Methylobacterium nodulans]|uniref:Hydantoinase/oxoprolinase n=1 Tax=Methylobacterium nodulans (strain LMG 21967 / CNCM I-2342 / ORS 2060) TaxID=460265 RepID=B8IME6_METNO|nr:hydantoinase/oxoprolinase family protein [Methylobacterium nodulans]ACL58332.1 Hydantoinase/oxoprolinase [Methylobacterium nodulans ORS 2060]